MNSSQPRRLGFMNPVACQRLRSTPPTRCLSVEIRVRCTLYHVVSARHWRPDTAIIFKLGLSRGCSPSVPSWQQWLAWLTCFLELPGHPHLLQRLLILLSPDARRPCARLPPPPPQPRACRAHFFHALEYEISMFKLNLTVLLLQLWTVWESQVLWFLVGLWVDLTACGTHAGCL